MSFFSLMSIVRYPSGVLCPSPPHQWLDASDVAAVVKAGIGDHGRDVATGIGDHGRDGGTAPPVPTTSDFVMFKHRATLDVATSRLVDEELLAEHELDDVALVHIGSTSVVVYGAPVMRPGTVKYVEVELGELDEALLAMASDDG